MVIDNELSKLSESYLRLLETIHCKYCGTPITLDFSQIDWADETQRHVPTPRDIDGNYHNCISKKMCRAYEQGRL